MRQIIKEIFNKEDNISIEDIEKFIIKPKFKESKDLEYKSTDKLKTGLIEEKNKEDILIKPLVSFLNKFSNEGGLLILGIYDRDGFPEKIASAKKELFSTEQLRSWIHSNISSVPPMKDYPFIDIKKTINEENPIFSIEIHPIDIHVVYFSKITNNVYSRKNDTSIIESLPDVYRLISEKKCAKVFIKFKEEREEKIQTNSMKIKLVPSYINEGFEPGEWVMSTLKFVLHKGNPEKIKIIASKTWTRNSTILEDHKDLDLFQTNQWEKDIIYPKVPMSIGNFEITLEKEEEIYMIIHTHEKKGRSKQIFLINFKEIIQTLEKFNTYI